MSRSYVIAKSLFHELANIEELIFKAQHSYQSSELWQEALRLIEKHTLNIKWRTKIARHLHHLPDENWNENAINEANFILSEANETTDSIQQGILYTRCGYYVEAQRSFSGNSEEMYELNSHLNVLQKNWAHIQHNSSKMIKDPEMKTNNEILLNAALANFCLGEYRRSIAHLLRIKPANFREACGVWLRPEQVRTLFAYVALLGLAHEELDYFINKDTLGKIMKLDSLMEIYSHLTDLRVFWDYLTTDFERLPVCCHEAQSELRAQTLKEWLSLHSRVPLDKAVESFGVMQPDDYSELDLIEDLNRWELPYKVDLENGWIVNSGSILPDTYSVAESLSNEYTLNLTVLSWGRQNGERDATA